jgi:Protein of unknown function (DUF3187)
MRSLLALALFVAGAASAAPFTATDQNPLLTGLDVANLVSARFPAGGSTSVSTTLNWSNASSIQHAEGEELLIDVESREIRFSLEHSISDVVAIRVQIPYRSYSGGHLDGFIENWHNTLNLPNGDRPTLPQDDVNIRYERHSESRLSLGQKHSGLGDVSLATGYQLNASSRQATSAWLSVKIPTGDSSLLLGNGALVTMLSIAHEQALSSRWTAYGQLSTTYASEGDLLSNQQRKWLASGMLAVDYCYSQTLRLTLQLDGHTAAFDDSNLELLGDVWILTVGGEYRWPSQWRLQVGVGEDIKVDASPDVNFAMSLSKQWR